MDSIQSTVFAAVTIDGKVHVFDLHHDKYKPLCVQVLAIVLILTKHPHPNHHLLQHAHHCNCPQGGGLEEPSPLDPHQLQLGTPGHHNRRQQGAGGDLVIVRSIMKTFISTASAPVVVTV